MCVSCNLALIFWAFLKFLVIFGNLMEIVYKITRFLRIFMLFSSSGKLILALQNCFFSSGLQKASRAICVCTALDYRNITGRQFQSQEQIENKKEKYDNIAF